MSRPRDSVDSTLRLLTSDGGGRGGGGRGDGWALGKYQLLQLFFINLGNLGASFQLINNVFTGRKVTGHHCSQPQSRWSPSDRGEAASLQEMLRSGGNSSHVTYGQCQITLSKGRVEVEAHPCLFGHVYDYPRELSFRTEYDLVCGRALLGDLLQTLVILGQGFGAVIASVLSDRYGRKRVLVWSQVGLSVVGMAIALSPTYLSLAVLKFVVGCFQQGVVTGKATMSIEVMSTEGRSLMMPAMAVMWMSGMSLLSLTAYVLQNSPWRHLQAVLSLVSLPIALIQCRYVDESLRWLVANGRKAAALRVLRHAATADSKDVNELASSLYGSSDHHTKHDSDLPANQKSTTGQWDQEDGMPAQNRAEYSIPFMDTFGNPSKTGMPMMTEKNGKPSAQKKLTFFDVFYHERLRIFTLVIWMSWFTTAFCNFTLFLSSTGLHGNRFLNFFLVSIMELPACLLFYSVVDRAGRIPSLQLFLCLCAFGVLSSAFCRRFEGNGLMGVMSLVTAMVGTTGATGVFGAMFFYTPEVYPTNIRQQSLGVASFAGRLGGMIAPFMVPLSEVVVWLPGAITGSLCIVVIFLLRLLPETQGRELPQSLEDIDSWDLTGGSRNSPCHNTRGCFLKFKWTVNKTFGFFKSLVPGSSNVSQRNYGVRGTTVL